MQKVFYDASDHYKPPVNEYSRTFLIEILSSKIKSLMTICVTDFLGRFSPDITDKGQQMPFCVLIADWFLCVSLNPKASKHRIIGSIAKSKDSILVGTVVIADSKCRSVRDARISLEKVDQHCLRSY